MKTIQVEVDDQIFERVQRLAEARHATLETFILEIIELMAGLETKPDPLWGMFGDEPELIDHVIESVMTAREQQPLRLPDG
jgi:hypothetical protein